MTDTQYVSQLPMIVATLKTPLECRNKRNGRAEKARIWEITDRTVRACLNEAVEAAHVPPFLRDTHAVCRYSAEGTAEPAQDINQSARRRSFCSMLLHAIGCSFRCRGLMRRPYITLSPMKTFGLRSRCNRTKKPAAAGFFSSVQQIRQAAFWWYIFKGFTVVF